MEKQNKRYEELREEFMPNSLIDRTLSRLKSIVEEINNKGNNVLRDTLYVGEFLSLEEQLLNNTGLIKSRCGCEQETLRSYVNWCTVKTTQKGIELYNKINRGEKHLKT